MLWHRKGKKSGERETQRTHRLGGPRCISGSPDAGLSAPLHPSVDAAADSRSIGSWEGAHSLDGDVKDRLSRLCDSPRLASSAGWRELVSRELGSRTERASVAGATARPLTRKQTFKEPIRRRLGGAAAAGEVQEGGRAQPGPRPWVPPPELRSQQRYEPGTA